MVRVHTYAIASRPAGRTMFQAPMAHLRTLLLAALLLTAQVHSGETVAPRLLLVPTFSACGVTMLAPLQVKACRMVWRPVGGPDWHPTWPAVRDEASGAYRTSLVGLAEDQEIEVAADLTLEDGSATRATAVCRTWTSTPPVARSIPLSDLVRDGVLRLEGLHGSATAWIRIDGGGATIDAGNLAEAAVTVHDSSYLLIEDVVVRGGTRHGVEIAKGSHHVRLANADIAGWGRVGEQCADGKIRVKGDPKPINFDAGVHLDGTSEVVVERCWIHDPRGRANAWKGPTWTFTHPEGPQGLFVRCKGGTVVRWNDLTGTQEHRWNDAIEGKGNGSVDGSFARDADIHGNLLMGGNDDGIELDGGQSNVRFWGNRIEATFCGISTAPNLLGPSWIFRNLVAELGDDRGRVGAAVKNGGGTTWTRGTTFFLHNTMMVRGRGIAGVGYGKGAKNDADRKRFIGVSRNNLLVSVGTRPGISDPVGDPRCDFDHDLLASTATPDGAGILEAAAGQESHGLIAAARLVAPECGDYRLQPDSPGCGLGDPLTIATGFAPLPQSGSSPDPGAASSAGNPLFPERPLALRADRTQILASGSTVELVRVSLPADATVQRLRICWPQACTWLEATTEAGATQAELAPGGELTVRITIRGEALPAGGIAVAAVLLRRPDGLSLPITVHVRQPAATVEPALPAPVPQP